MTAPAASDTSPAGSTPDRPDAGRPSAWAAPTTAVPTWVRIALVALGVPNVATGLWAVLAPASWFERFPGFDPRLVAAEPPFNAHLTTDAGAGLLASGVVLLLAAWLADRRTVLVALGAFAAFAIPHTAYHVLNPAPGLTTAENAQNAVLLGFTLLAVVVLAVFTLRRR